MRITTPNLNFDHSGQNAYYSVVDFKGPYLASRHDLTYSHLLFNNVDILLLRLFYLTVTDLARLRG